MRQTLAQLVLGLGALGVFCCGAAFLYWTIQGAYGLGVRIGKWRHARRIARHTRAINAIKREQMTEHWVRTEGWK